MSEYRYSDEERVDAAHAIGFREGAMAAQRDLGREIEDLQLALKATERSREYNLEEAKRYQELYTEAYAANRKPFSAP